MKTQPSDSNSTRPFISEIQIEDLFNLYTYNLKVETETNTDLSRLLILYGDNGSGKTTILKLIFNLLSSAPSHGHRTYVASVPFRRLEIRLGVLRIAAHRLNDKLIGSFQITVTKQRTVVCDAFIEAQPDNRVTKDTPGLLSYVEFLKELNLDLFYLSDERNAQSSLYKGNDDTWILVETPEGEYRPVRRRGKSKEPLKSEQILEIAMRDVEVWIRNQALKGSTEGEASTNTIYSDIAKRIARARGTKRKDAKADFAGLHNALIEIEQRSKAFSHYGLISRLQVGGIMNALETATVSTKPILANVLIPYVDGLRARLDALQEVQDLIEIFIESINSFFHNKAISFDLTEGIKINSSNGDRLNPNVLSSGERQLLLLFCNTITAREQASIFIIDEPEISLNVKWQRKLLQTLLKCTKGSDIQFIIATHSVELLARHKAHVLRLTSEPREAHA